MLPNGIHRLAKRKNPNRSRRIMAKKIKEEIMKPSVLKQVKNSQFFKPVASADNRKKKKKTSPF